MSKNQTIGIGLLITTVMGICFTVRYCDPPADVSADYTVAAHSIPAALYHEPKMEKFHFSATGFQLMKGALERSRINRCNETFTQTPMFKHFLGSASNGRNFDDRFNLLNYELQGVPSFSFNSEDELRAYYLKFLNDIESADRWLDSEIANVRDVDYSCRYI